MDDEQTIRTLEILDLFHGSYAEAVAGISTVERILWHHSFVSDVPGRDVIWPERAYSRINAEDLRRDLPFSQKLLDSILHSLEAANLCRTLDDGKLGFNLNIFQPFYLPRTLLKEIRPDSELRYYVMRSIRKHYNCNLSHETAHLFHLLADAINSYREQNVDSVSVRPWRYTRRGARRSGLDSASETKRKYVWRYTEELLSYLRSVLEQDEWVTADRDRAINLFVECCRAVGYLLPAYKSGHIDIRTPNIDAAYLLSNLFGMPTRMRGFDELFGGGGLMLTEILNESNLSSTLGGRSVLVMGRFGTGKSILSLHLAVEVARKGGAAWVMPLEQSAQECLYTLETIGALRHDDSMVIGTDVLSFDPILHDHRGERGALLISGAVKDSFSDFLTQIVENAARIKEYPLRLITVDPINSVQRGGLHSTELRSELVKAFDLIKRQGTNVLLVAEAGSKAEGDLLFEQNIADTVIHLTVNKEHGYAARYFEIQKSRLQREQRGLHPFSIVPGSGIRIYASSAAVTARMRPRSGKAHKDVIQFGMTGLDEILGSGSLTSGDIIVFQGAGGSFKTPLGLLFLLGVDQIPSHRKQLPVRSLLISARDDEASIRYILNQEFITNHVGHKLGQKSSREKTSKTTEEIIVCSMPRGYIQPGHVFQRIEDEITEARLKGFWIDRVMIDDIAHWEMSSPFIAEDETFGDTLIDFLHRHRVSGLLVCGPASTNSSVIQKSIVDGSNCLIQFDRIEFRGSNRVMLQVLKTRGMRHRRESFEVNLGPNTLDVKPTSSLLRTVRGETKPVPIRLFLNSVNPLRHEYNTRAVKAIKSVLSEDTVLEREDLLHHAKVMNLGKLSAVDELQILQFDEFQLPSLQASGDASFVLYKFPATLWDKEAWGDTLPWLTERIRLSDGSFFAVPFYENVSLLAHRPALGDVSELSWNELVEKCKAWEKEHPEPGQLFFDFPKATPENYNSLFLEILLGLADSEISQEKCRLETLLDTQVAIEAAKIYRQLCRRAYLTSGETEVVMRQMAKDRDPVTVDPEAIVWRHWYTSLNQMLHDLIDPKQREQIQVRPLPGEVSIAGEWYLGVTAYSAAPDVGLEVIRLLTSHEAELDRLQTGIGLPTKVSFFDGSRSRRKQSSISPYMAMNTQTLGQLIRKAYRRSDFGCYQQISNTLAHHLQRIIAIPEGSDKTINSKIKETFDSLMGRFDFVSSELICAKCQRSHLKQLKNESQIEPH
jgi:KaiC/GvpD/RAD55 family RecA-like ATPase